MPIPTLITDLSTTAASNYPAGSDSPSVLDDVQRAHASFIAKLRDESAKTVDLAASSGSSLIGHLPAGMGAVSTTVQDKLRESVSVEDFIANTGFITQAEYDAAATYALSRNALLKFTNANYSFSSLNLAKQNLIVQCGTKTTFTHTGVGRGLLISSPVSNWYNFELRGKPLIVGNAATTDGLFIESMHHSKISARIKDVVTGCRVNFGVLSEYDITVSVNEQAFAITPTTGLVTGIRNAGEYVQDCKFMLTLEGVSGVGLDLYYSVGNEFEGTSEGNGKGIQEASTCSKNVFNRMDMESNTVSDIETNAENSTYNDCLAISLGTGNNVELITARGTKFFGGFLRTVNCQATSADSIFVGVATSDNASLGIKGAGTRRLIGCVEQDVSGVVTVRTPDEIGNPGLTWTPSILTSGGGAQGAVTTAVGTYTQIGKLVRFSYNLTVAKGTLAAGAVSIGGLPLQARNTPGGFYYNPVGTWSSVALNAGNTTMSMVIAPGGTVGTLNQSGASTANAVVNLSAFPDPIIINGSGEYEAI